MTASTPASHRRRNITIIAVLILVVLVAGGGYGFWYLFLRPAGPAAVSSESLVLPSAVASSPLPAGGLPGTWNVDTSIGSSSDSTDSFVGYRVQEQLANIGANTAVGRTPNVTGSLTISGTQLTAATITADLTALQSDDQRRDGQLVDHGLETSTFPTATFTLTSPVDLGANATTGQEVDVTATGTLTLHGVTKTVQVPLKARLAGSIVEVVGSLPIAFSDYGVEAPNSFAVLSVSDNGIMELQLFFAHA